MQQIFRLDPQGDVHLYQTYEVRAGRDVEIIAACKDVGCPHWTRGWETTVDEMTGLGQSQADYIRTKSGRTFTERKTGDGKTVFLFDAHQRCFREHRTRPDVFLRRHGDFRGNPSGRAFHHTGALEWFEDLIENQQRLNEAIQKG
jgi:hypothetical protein